MAELCALLPELRERAEQGMWTDELDDLIAELRAGASAAEVARRLGLTGSRGLGPDRATEQQPGIEGARLDGLTEVVLSGDYRCPAAVPCARRARRDDRGHVPVCAVTGKPMAYRS
jgi:hypothetical protein